MEPEPTFADSKVLPTAAPAWPGSKAFRDLTVRVIAAEKPGFWGDWSDEQRTMYRAGDWLGFSRSRGYSEAEIADYGRWQDQLQAAAAAGVDAFALIRDLTLRAALRNLQQDAHGHALLSSHAPGQARDTAPGLEVLRGQLAALRAAEKDPGRVALMDQLAQELTRGLRERL